MRLYHRNLSYRKLSHGMPMLFYRRLSHWKFSTTRESNECVLDDMVVFQSLRM